MKAFLGSRISDHLAWTPEGYLICTGVVLCRTGTQDYLRNELFNDGDTRKIAVHRDAAEVLAPEHLASLEGKPVTGPGHPPMFLSPANVAAYQRGHLQNVRTGTLPSGEACLIGDLIITDRQLAEDIVSGKLRETSLGYDCSYESDGSTMRQVNLVANHLAIVPSGRANTGRPVEVKIQDGVDPMAEMTEAEAIKMLARISVQLGLGEPKTDAERQSVLDAARELDGELATMLDVPSQAAQEFADSCRQYHRGGKIGAPNPVVRSHTDRACRSSLRGQVADSEKKPLTPEEIAAEYWKTCQTRFRK